MLLGEMMKVCPPSAAVQGIAGAGACAGHGGRGGGFRTQRGVQRNQQLHRLQEGVVLCRGSISTGATKRCQLLD